MHCFCPNLLKKTQKVFMKLLFHYVGTGDVHKLYMYCFANTIIRVHTDHYFIGLNNCLLAIAAASHSSPPPPPPRFPSFSFFSASPSPSFSSYFSLPSNNECFSNTVSLGTDLKPYLNCYRSVGCLPMIPSRGILHILKVFYLNESHLPSLLGFSDSSVGKESACSAGDPSSIPGLGRSAGEGIGCPLQYSWASLVVQLVKHLPAMWETWIRTLCWEDPLEKGKATHSSILAWGIPWTV